MFKNLKSCYNSAPFTKILPWIILIVAGLGQYMLAGKRRCFGIFIASLHDSFNTTSMQELNWIGDSYACIAYLVMPLCTSLIINLDRSYRAAMMIAGVFICTSCMLSSLVPSPGYMFFTHTVLHGIGSTIILCTAPLVTGEYFDTNHRFHVLATTIVTGGSYGVLLFGPMYAYLVFEDGWRLAFRFVAIPFAITCLLGVIFFKSKVYDYIPIDCTEEIATKKKGFAICSLKHLNENKQILLWQFDRVIHNIMFYSFTMNLTAYVRENLDQKGVYAFMPTYFYSIGESFIFTLVFMSGDRLRGSFAFLYLISAFLGTIFLFALYYCKNDLVKLTTFAGLMGATIGMSDTGLYVVTEEVMFLHGSISYPFSRSAGAIGLLLAPIFSGINIDYIGYTMFFKALLFLLFTRIVLMTMINFILMRKREAIAEERRLLKQKENPVQTNSYQMNDIIEVDSLASSNYTPFNSLLVE